MNVFLDANIFIYAAGQPHPHKEPSLQFLRSLSQQGMEGITDAEVLQELLYRFWHLKRLTDGVALVEQAVRLVPRVLSVNKPDALLAATLLKQHPTIEPRDAIHAAVMLNHGLTTIFSYDQHFDRISGLNRVEPQS